MSDDQLRPAPPFRVDVDPGWIEVDAAIGACGGDPRAAVRALLVMLDHLKAELAERDAEIATLATSVSRGYARGRNEHGLPRIEAKLHRQADD